MVQMNSQMRHLLESLAIDFDLINPMPSNARLIDLLTQGVWDRDGAILLKELTPSLDNHQYFDLTDRECTVNHLHIEDYVGVDETIDDRVRESIAYAKALDQLLIASQLGRFRIHVACQISAPGDCVIRFHKLRESESPWLRENLDEYVQEAILEIDT